MQNIVSEICAYLRYLFTENSIIVTNSHRIAGKLEGKFTCTHSGEADCSIFAVVAVILSGNLITTEHTGWTSKTNETNRSNF